jgi:hypothetical protein
MRILAAIPHYFRASGRSADGRYHGAVGGPRTERVRALAACISALHQLFGRPQCVIDIAKRTTEPANTLTAGSLDVVVCTAGEDHALADLPLAAGYYERHPTAAEPIRLGFECHEVLRERLGRHDYYCYLEDDLILHDPWFFRKLAWFARDAGDECLLQPNRYEVAVNQTVHKAYVDGDLAPSVTAPFQDVSDRPRLRGEALGSALEFRRALNPHSGCFFLNARQMERWASRSYFLDRDCRFVGPLESAATLGVMRTFRVYKPAPECAAFLEIEHAGAAFLSLIRPPS